MPLFIALFWLGIYLAWTYGHDIKRERNQAAIDNNHKHGMIEYYLVHHIYWNEVVPEVYDEWRKLHPNESTSVHSKAYRELGESIFGGFTPVCEAMVRARKFLADHDIPLYNGHLIDQNKMIQPDDVNESMYPLQRHPHLVFQGDPKIQCDKLYPTLIYKGWKVQPLSKDDLYYDKCETTDGQIEPLFDGQLYEYGREYQYSFNQNYYNHYAYEMPYNRFYKGRYEDKRKRQVGLTTR